MTDAGEAASITAWIALNRAHRGVLADIEAALKTAGLPALAWYDVLLELERADPEGLRPNQLEPALLLPQYGLSRLVDRIRAAGLVERRPVAEDRRGHRLVLTAAGRATRRRMWPVYRDALRRTMGGKLASSDLNLLATLLEQFTEREHPHRP